VQNVSPNFFILISCSAFVFIFVKKIWPSLLEQLDLHIKSIQDELSEKEKRVTEYEKLKFLYQERLQHLHQEIAGQKRITEEKLNFLKSKLIAELDLQYEHRQKSFQKTVQRLQLQQRKSLQNRCVEGILYRIDEEIKKNPSFNDQYMVSLLKAI